MKRIIRERRLTSEEAAKNREVCEHAKKDFPPATATDKYVNSLRNAERSDYAKAFTAAVRSSKEVPMSWPGLNTMTAQEIRLRIWKLIAEEQEAEERKIS